LNTVRCSVFNLMVGAGQTDELTDGVGVYRIMWPPREEGSIIMILQCYTHK